MSTVGDKRSEDDYELESSIDDGIETIAHMEPTKTCLLYTSDAADE